MKHVFKLVETADHRDHKYYVFECDECLQMVRIEKGFFQLLISGVPLISFALKSLRVPGCNRKRSGVVIEMPDVPMCTACRKRAVADPGSPGLYGALCMICVYDL